MHEKGWRRTSWTQPSRHPAKNQKIMGASASSKCTPTCMFGGHCWNNSVRRVPAPRVHLARLLGGPIGGPGASPEGGRRIYLDAEQCNSALPTQQCKRHGTYQHPQQQHGQQQQKQHKQSKQQTRNCIQPKAQQPKAAHGTWGGICERCTQQQHEAKSHQQQHQPQKQPQQHKQPQHPQRKDMVPRYAQQQHQEPKHRNGHKYPQPHRDGQCKSEAASGKYRGRLRMNLGGGIWICSEKVSKLKNVCGTDLETDSPGVHCTDGYVGLAQVNGEARGCARSAETHEISQKSPF